MINLLHSATVHKTTGEKFKLYLGDRIELIGKTVVTVSEIGRSNGRVSYGKITLKDSKGNEMYIYPALYKGSWKFVANFMERKL